MSYIRVSVDRIRNSTGGYGDLLQALSLLSKKRLVRSYDYFEGLHYISSLALVEVPSGWINISVSTFRDLKLNSALPPDVCCKIDVNPIVAWHRLRHEADSVVVVVIRSIPLRRFTMGIQEIYILGASFGMVILN